MLPFFLATLRDRYVTGDALRDELQDLYGAVKQVMATGAILQVPPPKLFEHLLKLDFDEQFDIASQIIRNHPIASFLVHGGPGCGQQLLVNRLIRLLPTWRTGRQISVNVASNGTGKSSDFLWRLMAKAVGLSPCAHPERVEIAERICQWWKTQEVVFVFHNVDYMPQALLGMWLHDFWHLLVECAQRTSHLVESKTHLILFLVDYSGCVCDWEIGWLRETTPLYPFVPLLLPPLSRIPLDALTPWIRYAPPEVLAANLTAQALLEASDSGVPQLVYEAICECCGLSWEGDMARWLT